MTFAEFKAWLEGYSEAVKGAPTKEQWKRISEQLEKVSAPHPTYVPYPYYTNWPTWPHRGYVTCGSTQITSNPNLTYQSYNSTAPFDGTAALTN